MFVYNRELKSSLYVQRHKVPLVNSAVLASMYKFKCMLLGVTRKSNPCNGCIFSIT